MPVGPIINCADARLEPEFESYELVDAVAVEPVSTPKFPANRKINREFQPQKLKSTLDEVFAMAPQTTTGFQPTLSGQPEARSARSSAAASRTARMILS
jgi:hypothetical protein